MLYRVKLNKYGASFDMLVPADCEADVRREIETASLMHDEPSNPTVIVSIQEEGTSLPNA
jgi:hypothetical protein